jgi:SAM-dependent methyltransferase
VARRKQRSRTRESRDTTLPLTPSQSTGRGQKPFDVAADYYDAENARHEILKQDVPFFLGLLPNRRQSVLELAVGTGRAAIPIAQAGHRVVGVDEAARMLEVAAQKKAVAGLADRDLRLLHADARTVRLGERFDWVAIFFNSLLGFASLEDLDAVLTTVREHLKPRTGRFFFDLFHPDHLRMAREHEADVEPDAFFVPSLNRTVYRTTEIHRDVGRSLIRLKFHYRWFDARGRERRETMKFDATYLFPRELRILLERNGLEIESLWGNYDASPLTSDAPRMIGIARAMQ